MGASYYTVTALAAAANLYAASNDFRRLEWVAANMRRLGIPARRLIPLGLLKAAGAIGLLAGFLAPAVGVAAASGLVLFFIGAIVATVRARWYSHLPFPAVWLALAIAALTVNLRAV